MNDWWDYLEHSQKGQERKGHKYYARVAVGTDKFGRTKYRYFYSDSEWKAYKAGGTGSNKTAVDRQMNRLKIASKNMMYGNSLVTSYGTSQIPKDGSKWKVDNAGDSGYHTDKEAKGLSGYHTIVNEKGEKKRVNDGVGTYMDHYDPVYRHEKGVEDAEKRKKTKLSRTAKRAYHKTSITVKKGAMTVERLLAKLKK